MFIDVPMKNQHFHGISRDFQSKTSISMGKKRLFQLLGPDPEITTASGVLELREPLGLDC